MTIRGDPYWLGQTNIDRQIALTSGNNTLSTTLPDYSAGNQVILIYFRYPLQIGDNFTPVLQTNEAFIGFYSVNKVVHNFSDGAFKQTITSNRLPLLSAPTASSGSSSTASGAGSNTQQRQPSTTTSTSTFTVGSGAP